MRVSKQTFIDDMLAKVSIQQAFVNDLQSLSKNELASKPNAKAWNTLEIVEHMHKTMKLYTDQLKQISWATGIQHEIRIGFKGKLFAEGMRPKETKIRYKMQTMEAFKPTSIDNSFADFEETMQYLDHFLEQSKSYKWQGHKVVSALGPLVKFKIEEAINFLLAHNERHIQQINNTLNMI